jgi:hypothetical protein
MKEYKDWVLNNLDQIELSSILYVSYEFRVLRVNSNNVIFPPLQGASAENFFVPTGIHFYAPGHCNIYYEYGESDGDVMLPESLSCLIKFKLRGGVL